MKENEGILSSWRRNFLGVATPGLFRSQFTLFQTDAKLNKKTSKTFSLHCNLFVQENVCWADRNVPFEEQGYCGGAVPGHKFQGAAGEN